METKREIEWKRSEKSEKVTDDMVNVTEQEWNDAGSKLNKLYAKALKKIIMGDDDNQFTTVDLVELFYERFTDKKQLELVMVMILKSRMDDITDKMMDDPGMRMAISAGDMIRSLKKMQEA